MPWLSVVVDLSAYLLVGVGLVCRRQIGYEIRDVLLALSESRPEIPLHRYGVKGLGVKRYGGLLCSANSLAWSCHARRNSWRYAPAPGARTA